VYLHVRQKKNPIKTKKNRGRERGRSDEKGKKKGLGGDDLTYTATRSFSNSVTWSGKKKKKGPEYGDPKKKKKKSHRPSKQKTFDTLGSLEKT